MRINRISLIAEMAKRDFTIKKLAELSGISPVTISGIRNGKSCQPITAGKIAQALGVDVAELIKEG